jgi:hypothetical protein
MHTATVYCNNDFRSSVVQCMKYDIMAAFPNSIIRSMFAYINESQLSISMSPSQTFKIPATLQSLITTQEIPVHNIAKVTIGSRYLNFSACSYHWPPFHRLVLLWYLHSEHLIFSFRYWCQNNRCRKSWHKRLWRTVRTRAENQHMIDVQDYTFIIRNHCF